VIHEVLYVLFAIPVYTLTATASDLAGNPVTATATCAVPHYASNFSTLSVDVVS
jgi:hypothetical protein